MPYVTYDQITSEEILKLLATDNCVKIQTDLLQFEHEIQQSKVCFRVQSADSPGAEVYTDILLKNMTPYITTQVSAHNAKRKIVESTPTFQEFLQKYDEMKSKK